MVVGDSRFVLDVPLSCTRCPNGFSDLLFYNIGLF